MNNLRQCTECGGEFPLWCFLKLGRKRGRKKRMSICQACQLQEQVRKMQSDADALRSRQIKSRQNHDRYQETRRVKYELWEDGRQAAAGERA